LLIEASVDRDPANLSRSLQPAQGYGQGCGETLFGTLRSQVASGIAHNGTNLVGELRSTMQTPENRGFELGNFLIGDSELSGDGHFSSGEFLANAETQGEV